MEKLNFSKVGHSYLKYANPMSEEKIDKAISVLLECNPKRVIDIGSGNLLMLMKVLQRYNCDEAIGVELPGVFLEEERALSDKITLVEQDASKYMKSIDFKVDAALCIGSTHALGSYENCSSRRNCFNW